MISRRYVRSGEMTQFRVWESFYNIKKFQVSRSSRSDCMQRVTIVIYSQQNKRPSPKALRKPKLTCNN